MHLSRCAQKSNLIALSCTLFISQSGSLTFISACNSVIMRQKTTTRHIVSPKGGVSRFVAVLLASLSKMVRDARDSHAMHVGMDAAAVDGLWLEFGVFKGTTLKMMAKRHAPYTVHGFDSFRGLPEKWRNATSFKLNKYVKLGAFDMQGKPPYINRSNIVYHKGWFNQTLPPFLRQHVGQKIAFLHVDSDLYSSAKFVLSECLPWIGTGSVIVFDELVNFPEYKHNELLALYETFCDSGYSFELLGHSLSTVVMHPMQDYWPQAVAMRIVT